MQTSAEHPQPAPTENDEAIARAVAEAEAQQQRSRLWGRTHYHAPSGGGLQTHHHADHHGLASSAPPALAAHPHHHLVGLPGGGQSPEDENEDEEDDESVESLSQEAARALGRLPPGVRDSLRRMPSLEKGMAVNTANDEAIARAVAQSEQVASADAISIGRRFDRKIRRVLHRVKEGMADEVSAIKDAFRPRVNTFNSFEENDEYLNGKQLLKKRLDLYTLAEYSVSGNGDCQFASLADQLYRTTGMAAVVRHTIVNYLRANAERFRQYVPGDYTEYCNTMDKRGTWGDHVTLQAAANVYGVEIHLLTSYKDTVWMEIKPQDGAKTQKSLWLSFLAELHYNSLYSRQDLTSRVKAEEELRRSYASQDQAASSAPSAVTSPAAAAAVASAPAEEGNGPPVLADDGHHHCLLM